MKECPACKHCFPDEFNNCPTDGETLTHSIRGDTVLDSRYQLDERLGQGGMGIVYKAQHIFLKTSYAIKVILPDLVGNDPMLATRFRQEAMVAARIRHRNIVNVTDFGVVSGMPYLVMDFIKGRSLHDLLTEEGRLSVQRALEIMTAVCAGVGAAHRQGVVHRDLKPLNIMLQDGVPFSEGVKVLDFGLAKIKSGELLGSFVAAQSTGLMGSPSYMAPELWSDEEPEKAADIYSLGVITFEILTNDVPFKGSTIPSIMKKHLSDPPPRFVSLGLNLPPAIEAAVCHALAKKPADRPASVEAFLDELSDGVATASARMARTAIDEPVDTGALTMRYPKKLSDSGAVGETSWDDQTIVTDSQRNIADEADRLALEFEEAQRRADEARKRAEEAALRRAEEEAERKRAEEEAARKRAEEEAARKRAEEALKRQAAEEAERQRAAEEAARQRAEEQARKIAEEEAERQRVIEEAKRLAREVTEAQARAADARLRADEEASKRTEEAAARLRAEEEVRRLGLEVAEAERRAEEARQRAEAEALKRGEEAEARKRAEERAARKVSEEEARKQEAEEIARKRAAEEADRLGHEVAEAQRRAEEAGQRADAEARKRAEEEEARKRAEAEARKLALEMAELQRRAEEARQRAEAEALKRAEEAEARKQAEEEARRREEAQREDERMEATKVVAPIELKPTSPVATLRLDKPLPTQPMPDPGASQPSFETSAISVERISKPAVWIVLGSVFVFLILIGGGVAWFSLKSWSATTAKQPTPANSPTPVTGATPAISSAAPDLVKIEGGTFQMGRSDVSLDSKNTYDLSQYPARAVIVKTFWMDKTEVTNAEYEDFGRETKHSLPSYWRDSKPPVGQEQWPVTGVSLDDAYAFAQWRSKRDRLKYRLPTEDEWEYAARNGSEATVYPWGNQWLDDRANVDTNSLKPVGSHPQGASSRWGLLDLIGNAWEWTSTPATPYPGNGLLSIPPGQFIIRGGAFSDQSSGPKNITATRRSWLSRSDKETSVGFRLARDGP